MPIRSHRSHQWSGVAITTTLTGLLVAPIALAGTLSGRVSDSSGVKSLQGAEIELMELGRRVESGQDGAFRFADVPEGTYTLRARYIGSETVQLQITVAGETRNADLRMGAAGDTYIDNVLVVGQRASMASSLSRQRAADGVKSVLSRDGIGQFPDQNAAESLRRIAGINVLNDQGEGRFVAVRGLDPGLNSASINGARVPAPEADVRAVALDVIPSELIESIEIKKSLTPDMDADTIGASIEINTTSAFDRDETFLSFSGEGSYNDLTSDWSPKGSVDFSTTFGDRLGVAGGLSYYKREFATDNVEMDGWDATDDGVVFADTLEYRDYDVERTRLGGSLSVDFRASDETTLYTRLLHSKFEDQEYRGRLAFEMDEGPRGGSLNRAEFSAEDGEIKVVRDIKDRFEEQTITSLVAGGETFAGAWTFDYSASWSKAREKENGSLDPVEFTRDFDGEGELGVVFDYSDTRLPRYTITEGAASFLDPTEYEFDQIERTTLSLSEDEEVALKFDIARALAISSGELTIKFGGKARLREKTYDLQLDVFDGFDGDLTLADVAAPQSYGLAPIAPVPSGPAIRGFFDANRDAFESNDLDTAFESSVADYRADEDIYAGYLMGRYEQGPLRLVGGVRVEQTRSEVAANLVELVEEGGTRDGVVLEEDTLFVSPTRFERDYADVLPSLNLRYEAAEDVVLRAGVYASVVRPRVGQLAPRFLVEENVEENDEGELEGERVGEFGNPDLKPYEAWNLDVSTEWYLGRNGVLQGGAFYKSIDNFIVEAEFESITFNGIFADEAVIPINGEEATVRGLELGYQQSLGFLPAPMDGVLIGINYTYTDAEGEANGRTIPLPASSEHTYNVMLGYEKGPLSLRLTAAYRDKYLDELGGSAQEDRYVEDHIQVDLSAKYRVTPQFQLFGEFVNLGDEPYVAYQRGPGRARLLQYEEYSWTAKTGFRINF
jgi:TonB-dependent receptor